MTGIRRGRSAAAHLVLSLAALAAATPSLAQETSNSTVGPPVLRDFQLPGRRTVQAPPPATEQPPVTTPAPAPPARTGTPEARPAQRPGSAASRQPRAAPGTVAPASRRAATQAAPAAAAPPPQATGASPVPLPAPEQPQASAPQPAPVETSEPGGGSSPWVLLGAGAALALAAGLFLFLRRRRRDETDREPTDVDTRDAAPPVREPRPAAEEPPVTPAPRAWLEVDLRPERAAATENGATVHYELTLRNTGDAPARNIRIDPKLFNGAAEAEIAAFLQGPIHDVSGSPHIVVAAGASLRLKAEVAMPLADIREIEVQGVRIFVPAVAVNVAYDWTGGSGRTSRSWLVGREAEAQSPKMGAFRLDRGPRVYRQVGQREARKVMV